MIDKRAQKYFTRALNRFMTHTYTWQAVGTVPVLDGSGNPTFNEWLQPIVTDAYPIPGNKCLYYQWQDESIVNPMGTDVRSTGHLYVLPDDRAQIGDYVLDVMTTDGTILLTAATIVAIDPVAALGNAMCKILWLSGAVTS